MNIQLVYVKMHHNNIFVIPCPVFNNFTLTFKMAPPPHVAVHIQAYTPYNEVDSENVLHTLSPLFVKLSKDSFKCLSFTIGFPFFSISLCQSSHSGAPALAGSNKQLLCVNICVFIFVRDSMSYF